MDQESLESFLEVARRVEVLDRELLKVVRGAEIVDTEMTFTTLKLTAELAGLREMVEEICRQFRLDFGGKNAFEFWRSRRRANIEGTLREAEKFGPGLAAKFLQLFDAADAADAADKDAEGD